MKRILSIVCILAMVFSLCNVAAFAEETDIIIKTGDEFSTLIKNNMGATFVINGEEDTDDDGVNDGIILPSNYSSIGDFYGVLKGVTGKNNIKITSNKAVFSSLKVDKDAEFENLVIEGSVSVTATSHAGALINQVAQADAVGDGTVTFRNITNNASVSCKVSGKHVGGIIGAATKRNYEFINCVNNATVTNLYEGTAGAGGLMGGTTSTAGTVSFTSCYNYGTVSSKSGYTGGIGGAIATASTVKYCGNYGTVSNEATSSYTTYGVGGIIGQLAGDSVVTNCFNSGNITSTYKAAGIVGHCAATTGTISDCFNVGKITSTIGLQGSDNAKRCGAYGIAGAYNIPVTNCYNLGEVVNDLGYKYHILFPRVNIIKETSVNNYYVGTAVENDIGTQVTLNELAKGLPEGFSTDVWEYTTAVDYNYSLPQLKGNRFTNIINDDWYIDGTTEPEQPQDPETSITFSPVTDAFFAKSEDPTYDAKDEAGNSITGPYAVVAAKFAVTGIANYTYGMLISEDENFGECKEAEGLKNVGGAFGILFYGIETGTRYYVKPFVKFGVEYNFGEPTTFVAE